MRPNRLAASAVLLSGLVPALAGAVQVVDHVTLSFAGTNQLVPSFSLWQTRTQTLQARAYDGANALIDPTTLTFAWASSSPSTATVAAPNATATDLGVVTGVAAGVNVLLTASTGGVNATSLVSIEPSDVAGILMSTSDLALAPGESASLTAYPINVNSNYIFFAPVTWLSVNPSVASVNESAVAGVANVLGVALGSTEIHATSMGHVGIASVAVRTPGSSSSGGCGCGQGVAPDLGLLGLGLLAAWRGRRRRAAHPASS